MRASTLDKIRIFDTTLRDGDQTPGVFLTPADKATIARQLDRLGVDAIEAGTPITSAGELESVRLIAKEGLRAEVYGLARVVKEDVDAVVSSGAKYTHIFIATSDLHLKHKLRMTREQALQKSLEIIDYAKSCGLTVEFSPEDATRTDLDFLKKFCIAVDEAGVIRINIPDTVGIMTPNKMYQLVKEVKSVLKVPISVHCHNDFGMAVANSLAGVEAGADQIHVTINGLGERAGNAALEEVVTSLNLLYEKKTEVKTEMIYQTSQLVSKLSRIPVQPNKAIVGENAFTHESGIHTHGLISMPLTYEPIPPEFVGQRRKIVAGKHSGRHGIKAALEEVGLHPTEEQVREVVEKVREIGEKGRVVTDEDLMSIARDVMGEVAEEEKKIIELSELSVMTGTKMMPTASVRVTIDGKEFSSAEIGVGPVDAAMRAIQKATAGLVNAKLKEYRIEALTGGSDAVAEVMIKVEDDSGNVVSARAAREDIVKASVEAMVNGVNRLLLRQKKS
ncbi:MAG: 2-isopropylmalate synthase [Thermoproteota archaeon]|nr:2-isopropylmalate synthase [Thermoproteota archaeon]